MLISSTSLVPPPPVLGEVAQEGMPAMHETAVTITIYRSDCMFLAAGVFLVWLISFLRTKSNSKTT